jgi:bile acid:Na+ symporter, BASS family
MAFCPGMPMSLNTVAKHGGNRSLALALALTLSLLAVLLLPLSLALLGTLFPFTLQPPPFRVLGVRVLLPFLGPFLLGLGLQRLSPVWARRLLPLTRGFFQAALVASTLLVVGASLPFLKHLRAWDFVAMLGVTLGSAALGHAVGGPRPQDRTALALCAALGNPALALCVGAGLYPMKRLMGVVGLYLLLRTVTLLPYRFWNRRQARAAGDHPSIA